jgi:hypothetical protein
MSMTPTVDVFQILVNALEGNAVDNTSPVRNGLPETLRLSASR